MVDVEKFETILAFSKKKNTDSTRYLEEKLNRDRFFKKCYDIINVFEDSRAFLIFESK